MHSCAQGVIVPAVITFLVILPGCAKKPPANPPTSRPAGPATETPSGASLSPRRRENHAHKSKPCVLATITPWCGFLRHRPSAH
jgi:hypothetical protein